MLCKIKALGFLKGSMDRCLKIVAQGENLGLGVYSDGILFGDVISWSTKRQCHIAFSSAEADYISMSWACREVTSMRELLKHLLRL